MARVRRIAELLRQHGFVFKRSNGPHTVYEHPSGAQINISRSPSGAWLQPGYLERIIRMRLKHQRGERKHG